MSSTLHADLERLLTPAQVSVSPSVLEAHGRDELYQQTLLPDVVAFAQSTADVQTVLRYASEQHVPVTPFAVGSSLEGHALPRFGGISLDVSKMDALLELRPQDLLCVVQPGLLYPRLNQKARAHGLWMPVDPGAEASLGGMASTGASGTTTVKYGTMRDQVLALEVVLASGEVIRTGTGARKNSSGYDLTRLMCGAEGTLGVMTELTLKLHGLPGAVQAASVQFSDLERAASSAAALIGAGLGLARCELMDPRSLHAVNVHLGLELPEKPTLFLEFHGSAAGVQADLDLARELCELEGGTGFQSAGDERTRAQLWRARHMALWAMKAVIGSPGVSTDTAVPLSRLPQAIREAEAILDQEGLAGAVLGHVGDGNFHVYFPADPADAGRWARAERTLERLAHSALALGGTVSGEHGIGIRKRRYLAAQHGGALEVMRAIKRALDPLGILNPGKSVDPLESWPPVPFSVS